MAIITGPSFLAHVVTLTPSEAMRVQSHQNENFFSWILNSAKTGPVTGLLLSRECLSHDTTYFRTFVRTFESMLCRGSNIRVKVIGRYPDHSKRSLEFVL